jgi:fermentation-respiration switch protein FrsA (DUF1100 family)
LISYICFYIAFYSSRKKKVPSDEISLPEGDIYEPYKDQMTKWIIETRALPHEKVSITSFDGLKLCGKYYEFAPDAPIELMFHGYRGTAEKDLSGGVQRCFALGRNVLLVDQRASSDSEGHVISFGINESKDCLKWIDFILEHFGKDRRIILTGLSMGASTVMIAAGKDLPENVIGVLADCGYSTAKDIIIKAIREMKLPPSLMYPFVKLGARLYGHFDLEETSPLESIKNCKIPIIFVHGEADDFVPCDMSRQVFAACPSPKLLFTVPGAGHGLGYIMDLDGYLKSVVEFSNEYITPTKVVKYPV